MAKERPRSQEQEQEQRRRKSEEQPPRRRKRRPRGVPKALAIGLIAAALARGARDNVTALVLFR